MATAKPQPYLFIAVTGRLKSCAQAPSLVSLQDFNALACKTRCDVSCARALPDHFHRFCLLGRNHGSNARAYDGGLLARNLCQSVAQIFLMVYLYGCDSDQSRARSGRGIETAAQ